jgi:hypothetical protein
MRVFREKELARYPGQLGFGLIDHRPLVRKTPLFEPFKYKNDLFTKTGSGQT